MTKKAKEKVNENTDVTREKYLKILSKVAELKELVSDFCSTVDSFEGDIISIHISTTGGPGINEDDFCVATVNTSPKVLCNRVSNGLASFDYDDDLGCGFYTFTTDFPGVEVLYCETPVEEYIEAELKNMEEEDDDDDEKKEEGDTNTDEI